MIQQGIKDRDYLNTLNRLSLNSTFSFPKVFRELTWTALREDQFLCHLEKIIPEEFNFSIGLMNFVVFIKQHLPEISMTFLQISVKGKKSTKRKKIRIHNLRSIDIVPSVT